MTHFKFNHIDIQAQSAGSIADAEDWTFSDMTLNIKDSSAVKVTDSTNLTGLAAAAVAAVPAGPGN